MNDDQKFEEAKDIINTFAGKLSALNNGEDIPPTWKNYLIKAVRPLPKKPGLKIDSEKTSNIVKCLIQNSSITMQTLDRTSVEFKDKLAKDFGVSRRTITRIDNAITSFIRGEELAPKMKVPIIDGVTKHWNINLDAAAEEDRAVRRIRAKNQFPHPK